MSPPRPPILFAAALGATSSTDLYTIDESGHVERLTNTPEDELFPRWSPNRDRLAFVSNARLFVAGYDGTGVHLVADHVGRNGRFPLEASTQEVTAADWSPDGQRLVYSYPRKPVMVDFGDEIVDESYATTLHFVNADGTGDVAWNEPSTGGTPPEFYTITEPAWSSSGRLAFHLADDCSDCAGGYWFGTAGADGTGYADVTADQRIPNHDLDWAPDGARWTATVHANWRYESPGRIAVFASGVVTELTTDGAYMPRWSQDGGAIAFLRADGIYVMNADGTNQRRVLAVTGVRGIDW